MKIKAEKQRSARYAVAFALAASIVLGSTTVALATRTDNNPEKNSINSAVTGRTEIELINGDMVVKESVNFDVLKANKITVQTKKSEQTVMMAKGTVADVLEKSGITLSENQIAIPNTSTEIVGNMTVKVYEAKKVTVTADGETKQIAAPEGNIVESLNMLGYAIGEDDILNISRSSEISDGMKIRVQRVVYGEETVNESIAYKKTEKTSDKVALGKTKISVKGVNGEKLVTRKCKYVDGKKVSSEEIGTKVIKEAVDEVKLIGTKGAAKSGGAGTFKDMYGNSVAYSRVLTGSGTAYTAPAGAGTATGVKAYHGGVAVNPNIIPYGSKLYIVSTDGSFVYGYATAVDTGGALMAGTAIVDCFYNTYGECVNFGRRNVNVYVIA